MYGAGTDSKMVQFLRRFDYVQFAAVLVLLTIGLIFIRSTGIQVDTAASRAFFTKQLQWVMIGFGVYFIAAVTDYRAVLFRVGSGVLYVVSLFLLIYVLFAGARVWGATRWINFGSFQLQPSEPAKLAVIAVLAIIFSNSFLRSNRLLLSLSSFGITGLPFFLIAIEPDLGSAMSLVPICCAMIFCAGIKWRYIIFFLLAAALGLGVLTVDYLREKPVLLKNYQRNRIRIFLNPDSDRRNLGHNAYQAKLATGSGGLTGKGIGQGTQNELGFLPQTVANNDFIFSVIAEETGFIGVLTLLGAYFMLLYSILRTAFFAPLFGRYLAIGGATLIFFHVFVNIGMSLGLTPITGLPLPLVSYGGSFILTVMLTLGVMQSVYIHNEI